MSDRKLRRSSGKKPVVSHPVLVWLGLAQELPRCCIFLITLLVWFDGCKTTHENRFAFNGLQVLREEANQLTGMGQLLLSKALSVWTAE